MTQATIRTCSVDDCQEKPRLGGLCNAHSWRKRRYGDPLATPPPRPKAATRLEWLTEQVQTRDRTSGCWEWPHSRNAKGYGQLAVNGTTRTAHNVVLEVDGRPVPGGGQARHLCHNPPCFNPAHLEPGTPQQNADDSGLRGWTADEVRALRARWADGESVRALIEDTGRLPFTVMSMLTGLTYADVPFD
jgi:hypothetical protein